MGHQLRCPTEGPLGETFPWAKIKLPLPRYMNLESCWLKWTTKEIMTNREHWQSFRYETNTNKVRSSNKGTAKIFCGTYPHWVWNSRPGKSGCCILCGLQLMSIQWHRPPSLLPLMCVFNIMAVVLYRFDKTKNITVRICFVFLFFSFF